MRSQCIMRDLEQIAAIDSAGERDQDRSHLLQQLRQLNFFVLRGRCINQRLTLSSVIPKTAAGLARWVDRSKLDSLAANPAPRGCQGAGLQLRIATTDPSLHHPDLAD